MAQPLYLSLVLLAAVVGMGVAFFAWLQGDRPGARPLTVFVVAASFWAVAEGLTVASTGVGRLRLWTQVGLTFSTVIPIAWLVTVLEYTGRERWLTRRRLALLLVEPAVFVALVWSNTGHGLVWTDATPVSLGQYSVYALEFGLAFWGHQVYSYLLVAAGAFLLVGMVLGSNQLYRSQSTALLLAIGIPMTANAVYIFRLVPSGLNPSGLAYVLTGIVLAVAMFRAQLLRVAPAVRELGREEVLSELDDCVFILDENDRLVEANPAGQTLLDGDLSGSLGHPLDAVLSPLARAVESGESPLQFDVGGQVRYYDVQVSTLSRGYGTLSGTLVSLRDVTDQRRREQRLDVLNRILRHNIRNDLNVVRGNVDLACERIEDEGAARRLDTAAETIDSIVDRSKKVGRLSRLFEADTSGTLELTEHLDADLEPLRRKYPDAEIEIELPDGLAVAAGPTLTVAFEELVVNAIEHNDGDHPRVDIALDDAESDDEFVVVTVADDGPGIDQHELRMINEGQETPLKHASGVGLWLATWVVEYNGGTIEFETTDRGTVVSVRLPRTTLGAGTTTERGDAAGVSDQTPPDSTPEEG